MHLISSRLECVWFSSTIARLVRLSWLRGAETRRRPCIVRIGDRCEVRHYKGEVSIALILVLNITPLAVIYAVVCAYSKWLKVKCLIGWPRLSKCIQRTYSFSSIYILRDRAVFFRSKVVVQSSKISTLFAVYIGLLVLSTFFTIS